MKKFLIFFYFFVDILKKICIFALYYVQKTTIY